MGQTEKRSWRPAAELAAIALLLFGGLGLSGSVAAGRDDIRELSAKVEILKEDVKDLSHVREEIRDLANARNDILAAIERTNKHSIQRAVDAAVQAALRDR